MVKEFYDTMGFTKTTDEPDGSTVWTLDVSGVWEKRNTVIARRV